LLSNSTSTTNHLLEFTPWSHTGDLTLNLAFKSYLGSFDSSSSIIIDVSAGFCKPRLINSVGEFEPQCDSVDQSALVYSDTPPSYMTNAVLASQECHTSGLNYIFIIRAGAVLEKEDTVASRPDKWICQVVDDLTMFVINSSCLRRVGLEDPIPDDFTWSEKGVDAQFGQDEPLPLQHSAYLGHGSFAVVDKVQCLGRVLARKQIRTNRRLPLSVAKQELQSIRKIQKHHHVLKVVGSYIQAQTLGIVMHPAAECDLQFALEQPRDSDVRFFDGRVNGAGLHSRLWTYFGCLANGLMYMHENGIRHRDIKPRNILVTFDGPLYTDFGMVSVLEISLILS
jgi:hypothetical protein